MSGEKNIEAPELIAPGTVSDSPLNQSGKEMEKGDQSNTVTPMPAVTDATSGAKTDDQPEQGLFYQPTSYEYYYPGYNCTFPDDKGYYNAAGGSYTGNVSDNNLYYYPGYGSYTTGYASTEYLQQPCSYGSDAFPRYSYDSTYSGNVSTGTAARSDSAKPVMGPSGSGKSNVYSNPKMSSGFSSKPTSHSFNSKAQQQSSNFSKPAYQNQDMKSTNKFGSNSMKGYQSSSKFTFTNRHPDYYAQFNPANYRSNPSKYHSNTAIYHSNLVNYQSNPVNYQSNNRASYNNNYRYKSREAPARNPESETLSELTRGPRSDSSRNSSPKLSAAEAERAGLPLDTGFYNSKEFKIEYDDAKFFVIKSYSEDDVHKCMKYDVWSSTPNGNKKLDAAYREADAKMSETDGEKTCPIFLFFSVNGSGQFVGVAEMIGQVDFTKNMDFWQLDKWSGFFPLKWHIIKDVPNTLLRHITLENNENKPVTYSRDTQEIGLKQGLEMLGIFKKYSERTSVLDDFNFYENREKSFKMKKNAKSTSQIDGPKNIGYEKQFKIDEEMAREQLAKTDPSDPSALISLTKNLSLNS